MKKKLWLSATILCVVSAVMVSCSMDEESGISAIKNREVKFSSDIITVDTDPKVKMGGNSWHEDDEIGVYMLDDAAMSIVESKGNIPFTAQTDGSTGTFVAQDQKIYFPDDSKDVRFMAYYPYQATLTDEIYKVDVSDQRELSKIDLLYSFEGDAIYNKSDSGKEIPLVFEHQLTNLIINIKPGGGLVEGDLSELDVYLSGFNTLADFDLMSKSLANPSVIATITPVEITPNSGYTDSYEAIILPVAEVPEGAKIVFDLQNGNLFTWNFDKALETSTRYVYNVTINRSEIIVEATINDWTNGGSTDVDAE